MGSSFSDIVMPASIVESGKIQAREKCSVMAAYTNAQGWEGLLI